MVIDAADDTWVRVNAGERPWVKVEDRIGLIADWDYLAHPVTIRNHGWQHP